MNLNDANHLVQEVISEGKAFESLAGEWSGLLARSRTVGVFMQWEWHYTWWQVFAGKRDQLHIVTWRARGQLVGLLPLYLHSKPLPGLACLRFLGTGEPQIDEVATEYGDLLADQGTEQLLGHLAARYLGSFRAWNCVELCCLLDDAVLKASLIADERNFMLERSEGQRYRISLQGDEANYLESLEKGRRKRILRSQRAALRDGGMRATSVDSVEDFDRAFKELAELNHERQSQMQRKSVFTSSRFRQFHSELCLRLYDSGAADIVRFHLNTRLLAVLYCFYDAQSCYYYQSGFAKKDANKYMPLTLAHVIEMQNNREAGRSYYDLMRGQPPCYKDDFACETTAMVSLSLYSSPIQLHLAKLYRRARSKIADLIKRRSS